MYCIVQSNIIQHLVIKIKKVISPSENRTPVSRVTGACTGHYTKGDCCISDENLINYNITKYGIFTNLHFGSRDCFGLKHQRKVLVQFLQKFLKVLVIQRKKWSNYQMQKSNLSLGESNSGLVRDRHVYWPLYEGRLVIILE